MTAPPPPAHQSTPEALPLMLDRRTTLAAPAALPAAILAKPARAASSASPWDILAEDVSRFIPDAYSGEAGLAVALAEREGFKPADLYAVSCGAGARYAPLTLIFEDRGADLFATVEAERVRYWNRGALAGT